MRWRVDPDFGYDCCPNVKPLPGSAITISHSVGPKLLGNRNPASVGMATVAHGPLHGSVPLSTSSLLAGRRFQRPDAYPALNHGPLTSASIRSWYSLSTIGRLARRRCPTKLAVSLCNLDHPHGGAAQHVHVPLLHTTPALIFMGVAYVSLTVP